MHLWQFSLFPREMYIPKFTIVLLYFWIVSRKNIHCVYFSPYVHCLPALSIAFDKSRFIACTTMTWSHIQTYMVVFAFLSGPFKYSTLSNSCWGLIEKSAGTKTKCLHTSFCSPRNCLYSLCFLKSFVLLKISWSSIISAFTPSRKCWKIIKLN